MKERKYVCMNVCMYLKRGMDCIKNKSNMRKGYAGTTEPAKTSMKFKKFIVTLLICAMSAAMLSACGGNAANNAGAQTTQAQTTTAAATTTTAAATTAAQTEKQTEEAPAEKTREPVTIKMLGGAGAESTFSTDNDLGKMINELFNVTFEFIPMTESHYEKARLMLAAMDFGDIDIVNTALDDITQAYISADVLTKLDDYLPNMPQFKSYHKDTIPYWRNLDTKNGNLYVWQASPDQIQMTSEPLDMNVRVDALEAMDWPDLDTTDDYIAFIEGALKKIPETKGRPTIGFGAFWGDPVGVLLTTYLPRHSSYQHFYKFTGLVDVDNACVVNLVAHPYLKESLRFYNKMTQMGLIDREAWTDGFPEFQAKFNDGAYIVAFFAKWMVKGANANLTADGRDDQHYIVTPIRLQIAKDEGRNIRYELFNGARPDDTRGILKTSKYADRMMEVIEYTSTLEMTIRNGWGIEGRDYAIDANGLLQPTKEFMDLMNDTSTDAEKTRKSRGYGSLNYIPLRQNAVMSNGQACSVWSSIEYIMAGSTPTQMKAYKAYGWKTPIDAWWKNKNFEMKPFDVTKYVVGSILDPESEEGKTEEKIQDYCRRQIPVVINSANDSEFESNYNELVASCEQMGNAAVVDKYNEQLKSIVSRLEELSKR